MNASDRLNDILKSLNKYGSVSVKELAINYRVTEDLIRKDLKKLESQGLLDRVYGGAQRIKNKFEASSLHYRMQVNTQEKTAIARKAVSLIKNGEYIYLDTSSTSAHIAQILAQSNLEITVLTDMVEVIQTLANVDDITLIAIGGQYNPYTGGFLGQESVRQISQYTVDKAFISCRSVSLEDGYLIEGFIDIGNTKRAILEIARTRIVATQALKYRSSGVYRFYKVADIDMVIVDKPLEDAQVHQLKELEVTVLVAE